jgi:hypothetical protein
MHCVEELVHRQTELLRGHRVVHSTNLERVSRDEVFRSRLGELRTDPLPGGLVQLRQQPLSLHVSIHRCCSIDLAEVRRLHAKAGRR